MIAYEYVRPTDKEHGHTAVFLNGSYIGYIMKNTSKYAAMHENWNFEDRGSKLKSFHAPTLKDLKVVIEGSVFISIMLPAKWSLSKHSTGDGTKYFGSHDSHSKCVIYTEYKVVSPTHGYYGAGSKDVKSLAKKLGYEHVEEMSTWMYKNLDWYKEQCDKFNKAKKDEGHKI